ncbi:MAG: HAD family hydrolase [Chlamydiales bacterium]
MNYIKNKIILFLYLLYIVPYTLYSDPLPSWNEGEVKQQIISFVSEVTNLSSLSYILPSERIAVFDHDGTLWCEKPLYIHIVAIMNRFTELIEQNPKLIKRQPYKAIATKDPNYFPDLYDDASFLVWEGQLVALPFGGMTLTDYAKWNELWLQTWRHPRFHVGYKELTYKPMLELIEYLKSHHFRIYIVTADEAAFVRLFSQELYDIPPENVLGSSVKLEFVIEEGEPQLLRSYQMRYLNNHSGKPRLIEQTLGKRPVFAVGNSNGDLEMLLYTGIQTTPSLVLLVHHTDEEREYAYNKNAKKVLDLFSEKNWPIINMKEDWKAIFPPSSKEENSQ